MFTNDNVFKLQKKYHSILLNNGGLRTLCNTLSEEINNHVFILDKYKEDLLYADRELRENEEFFLLLEKGELSGREIIFSDYETILMRSTYVVGDKEWKLIQVNLGQEDELFGILSILEEKKLNEEDYLAVIQGASALSLKLHQNYLVQNLVRKCSSELIEDLLQGRLSEKDELVKRGELAGWDLTVPYQLFIIDYIFTGNERTGELEKPYYSYEMEERIIRNLHRIIKTTISRKYIIFSYDKRILLLVHYPEESVEIKKEIENVLKKLLERFDNYNFNIGAGRFTKDCRLIPRSYQEGVNILEFMAATKQKNKIFFYDDLGILRLLWQVDYSNLKQFVEEYLGALIKYDRENKTDWLETLGIFLEEGGSIQNAAEKLYIHPNTMSYRLKRIQEILECDVHNFDTRLNLATAYRIYKFIISREKGD